MSLTLNTRVGSLGLTTPSVATPIMTGYAPTATMGSGLDLTFASDWASGSLTDGGKWTTLNNDPGHGTPFSVVSATGRGFPSGLSNVLQQYMYVGQGGGSGIILASGYNWPAIAVGETHIRRWYERYSGNPFSRVEHCTQVGSTAGDCCGRGWWEYDELGGSGLQLSWANQGVPIWFENDEPTVLSLNHTYRVEYKITCESTTGSGRYYFMDLRIYDAETTPETLLLTAADYHNHYTNMSDRMTTYQHGYHYIPETCQGVGGSSRSHWFTVPNPPDGTGYIWFGGFAVLNTSDGTAWIGPYVPGEAT